MKKKYFAIYFIVMSLLNLALLQKPQYAGLLTDGYGIVNLSDLDEEGQRAFDGHFPNDNFEHYWFCIKPDEYFVDCENIGPMDPEGWPIGQPSFWIRSGVDVYDIGTRRNWDMKHCTQMITDWTRLMKGQPVVCVSAMYLSRDGNRSEWVIDRMKTRQGEWSWFAR